MDEGEELTCPMCNNIVQEEEDECYLCGTRLVEDGLNYGLADQEEFTFD